MAKLLYEDITYEIRGACYWVWKEFRGAFKERVIDRALTIELRKRGRKVINQKRIDIYYRGEKVGTYVPDKIVDDKVLVELKCKECITQQDIDQFWKYLKGSKYKLGLLINFGPKKLDIRRVVYDRARAKDPRGISVIDQRSDRRKGFSLVETLLAIAILVLLVTALGGAVVYGLESTALSGDRARAVFYAEEGLEAARNLRDESFDNLIVGTHGVQVAGGQWVLSGTSDTLDKFTRSLEISDVDDETKMVTAIVDWQQNPRRVGHIEIVTYLTNWNEPEIEVGDWSSPEQEGSVDIQGNSDAIKVDVKGDYAFVVRGGGDPDFVVVDITDTTNPSVVSELNLPGSPRNIAVSGNYAYVASTRNNQELQIIDISTPSSASEVGSYNAAGGANAMGIDVVGTSIYLVRAASNRDEFLIIDVADPASPTLIGSADLGNGRNNEVSVDGSFAYVASNRNSEELKVVDISTPSSPSQVGSFNLSGSENAMSVVAISSVAVLGRDNGELYTIDVSDPTSPAELGMYQAQNSETVRDIDIGNNDTYAFLATDEDNNDEFQVVDISDLANPSLVGSFNTLSDLNGVAYHITKDRAVVVGNDDAEEVIVLGPVP